MAGTKKTSSKKFSGGLGEICGYKVLPVRFDSDEDAESATHYIYFKQHVNKVEDILLPSNRTVFMYNLPVDTTERDIRRLLHGIGRVERVIFHDVIGQDAIREAAIKANMTNELAAAMAEAAEKASSHKKSKSKSKSSANKAEDDSIKPVARAHLLSSGGSAHVVLLEEQELVSMLKMKAGVRQWPERDPDDTSNPLEYRGLTRYLYEYRAVRPPAEMLKEEVDSYMAKFQEAQYERDRMLSQQQNVPDADGFITVVRRGRTTRNGTKDGAFTAASVEEAREAGENKKKDAVFGNMYRFQVRERKQDQLTELRKKFEEDKEKIARMRQTRQFRPY